MPPDDPRGVAALHVPGTGDLEIHRLGAGLVNETYRVLRAGNAYSMRLAVSNSDDLGLDRACFADRHGARRAVELAHRDLFLRDGHAAASGHRGGLRFTDSPAGLAAAGQKSRRGQRHGESGLDGTSCEWAMHLCLRD